MVVTGHRIKFFIDAEFQSDQVKGREVYLTRGENGETIVSPNDSIFKTIMTSRPSEVIPFSDYHKVVEAFNASIEATKELFSLSMPFHRNEVLRDTRIGGEVARMEVTGKEYQVKEIHQPETAQTTAA